MKTRRIVANKLDGTIIVSVFQFKSYYYVPFRTDALAEGMNSFNPQLQSLYSSARKMALV